MATFDAPSDPPSWSSPQSAQLLANSMRGCALFTTDVNGNITSWHPNATRILGWREQDVLGSHYRLLSTPQECAKGVPEAELEQAADQGRCESSRWQVRNDGSQVFARLEVLRMPQPPDALQGALIILKPLLTADVDTHQKFSAVIQASPLPIVSLTAGGVIDLWNPAAERLFGWTAAEVLGQPLPFIPEEKYAEHRSMRAQDLEGTGFQGREIRRRRKDGTLIDLQVSTAAVRDEAGVIIGIMSLYVDVTERKRTEDALRASEERQRLAVDAGKIGLWDWDILNDKVLRSDLIYEFYAVSPESLAEREPGFASLVHPDDRAAVLAARQRALDDRQPYEVEFRVVRPNGEVRWLMTNARAVYDEENRPVRMLGAVLDITERRRAEDALRLKNEELEEFAYVASHDLQEPLRTINIYTQLLSRHFDEQNEEVQEFSKFITSSVRRMQQLILDLLAYSRENTRNLEILSTLADLNASLREALAVLQQRIEESEAIITADDLPTLWGDPAQFSQVFQNLISNALKYRRKELKPVIQVSAGLASGEWVIRVQDNGIGFDPQYKQQVFGLFKRLHRDAEYPGTGLGLAICKRIVERCGGRMWAESQVGEGSSFYFALPAIGSPAVPDSHRPPVAG